MNSFRYHWFDFAIALAIMLAAYLIVERPEGMQLVMWLSLASLFLHQFEEWRFPGYFPGMLNVAMFRSSWPDRYPLNANSGMVVNVGLGWTTYLLAALLWQQAIWLAIATIMVSVGNILAHTIIFNIKGNTRYNPGLITCWLCFAPVVYLFGLDVTEQQLASGLDWGIGILMGILLNYFGIYKLILWMADPQSPYTFSKRFLMPGNR